MPKTFYINTLGCKVNQYESDNLACILEKAGMTRVGEKQKADVVVVNTCTVTHKASTQSRQALRQAIKAHKGALVLATGCYAQSEPEALESIKGVSFVVDNTQRHLIPQIIEKESPRKSAEKLCGEIRSHHDFPVPDIPVPGTRSRPFLKIQDGCNAFCTYCIVPYTRGPSRSMPWDAVLRHVAHLTGQGFGEIVFTGIHLGYYGQDLDPPTDLVSLLKELEGRMESGRLRLSSIEPKEVSQDLLDLMAGSKRICPHLHLPLQSGDSEILERMNRPYSAEFFEELVHNVRKALPEAGIGVDVLVGFPGETEEHFKTALSLLERLPASYFHVFPYSQRQGTPAAKFPDQVPPDVLAKRTKIIRDLGGLKRLAFHAGIIGKTVEVCVEGRKDAKTGLHKGVARNYVPVLFSADAPPVKSSLVRVKAEKLTPKGRVIGTLE
ncbi:tRNA (N(6)-L-threonylcarbamoyladenosine(37)-C(2))-methylthiotransferase MtaB [Desulfatibacillum aliphaticivorans]|uniref:tRNA (N(6)-L-threonylcarbamoyladenosine(37)-C(2))- methylthiotransferase MtaB n=1 Tax=Desulfatibacillum aliphaticivorans TaxID=218208 RepID=UPI000400A935|nr:tRNA (N(6)-L-threonylcarbamoyladenosine(37)-C(2))-methylthiotransferase MtaB [Desulfatibacillum aliphaticivorans]